MDDEAIEQLESIVQGDAARAEALAEEGKCEVEFWIVLNESGDYQIGIDEEQAVEDFDGTYGGDRRRTFHLFLNLPMPQVMEARGELPEAEGNAYSLEVRPA